MQLTEIQPIVIKKQEVEQNSPDNNGVSFGRVLSNAVGKVNDAQLEANKVTKDFLTGDIQDIHQVTISMEKAKLTMEMAVEVRNKMVEAYQEISRMQV